jgi:hypothetical protein
MNQAWRIDPNALRPFNDAPNYLTGEVVADDFDNLAIRGHAQDHMQGWHNIGARSGWLEPESFEIVASTISLQELGACSTRIVDENRRTRIAISHFVRSSVDLRQKRFISNFYSGFGHNDDGLRSQIGLPAEWDATGRHHNVSLRYDHEEGLFACYANNVLVHAIPGRAGPFALEVIVQAVGVEGDYEFRFERLMYRSLGTGTNNNRRTLRCWLPEFSPTFVSYSHADKETVLKLSEWLQASGVRVMGDWDFQGGDSLIERISKHISRASFLIVALSPASVSSRWVSRELEIALNRQLSKDVQLRIVPILLAPCEIPLFLQSTLRFDFTSADAIATRAKLLETLSYRQRW